MPLQRYLLVEGVLDKDGHALPVTNPHMPPLQTGATARYVGWKPKADPHPDPIALDDVIEPMREVVLDHGDLRRAAQRGDLKIHGEFAARSHAEAVAKLMPTPARTAPVAKDDNR